MLSRINLSKYVSNKYLILLDQSLLSIINFGSILIISKLASINVFGSFVVTYSYSYFIYIFSTFFLSSPILIFLSKKWKFREGEYLSISLFFNFGINLFFSVITYFFLIKQVDAITYLPFFLLSFSMSFFDILKKFIFSSINVPVKYGLYATAIVNLLFFTLILIYKNDLTLERILNVYWISFGFSAIFLVAIIFMKGIFKRRLLNDLKGSLLFAKEILEVHFHYSKWIILGGIAFWGYSQGVYILAKAFSVDDFTIGKVRTIQNLLGVFNILLISLESHYIPIFSRISITDGLNNIFAMTKRIFSENMTKISILFLIAIPVGLLFYNLLYYDKYGSGIVVFMCFLLIQILLVFVKPCSIALKSIERTKPFFISHLLAITVTLIFVPVFKIYTVSYSIPFSLILANCIYVLYIIFIYRRIKANYRT